MKLGNILGSISPAFGMASGKGMFGNMGSFPMFGLMGALLGRHGGGGDEAPVNDSVDPNSPETLATPAQSGQSKYGGPPVMAPYGQQQPRKIDILAHLFNHLGQ